MAAKTVTVLLFLTLAVLYRTEGAKKLVQVLALSRHGIRTPLTDLNFIKEFTPYKWPEFNTTRGFLTAKGALLEKYMGDYLGQWLRSKELLPNGCPNPDNVYVLANSMQRTIESAKAFIEGAFKHCKIEVNHGPNYQQMDPLFDLKPHNASLEFVKQAEHAMQRKVNYTDIDVSYEFLEEIIDMKNSNKCKHENYCKLNQRYNKAVIKPNKAPIVLGPMRAAFSMVDLLLMAYYEGKPYEEVGWNKILSFEDWQTLYISLDHFQNVRFNTDRLTENIARPMMQYVRDRLLDINPVPFHLIMGHDTTICTLLTILKVNPYRLPEQCESTPISGILVFQKYNDTIEDRYLLKLSYLYPSMKQLRYAHSLTGDSLPYWMSLELSECEVDDDGYCDWDVFEQILNNTVIY